MNIKTRTGVIVFSVSIFVSVVSAIFIFAVLKHQAESTIAKLAEQESWRVHHQLVEALQDREGNQQKEFAENVLKQMLGESLNGWNSINPQGRKLRQ